MSDVVDATRLRPPKRPLRLSWSDERFRGIVWQVVVVGLVAGLIAWLWRNTVHNLDTRHIATGFGFLTREAGMPIADALIPYKPSDTYLRALAAGILNTLRVAVIGVVLATVLGTLIGIARLSKNWLLARLAAVYVEVLRDLPLLLQLLSWYVLLQGLPAPRQALNPVSGLFLSNRGLVVPGIAWQGAHGWVLLALVVGIVLTWLYRREALARRMRDGQPRRIWPAALVLIVGLPAAASAALGVSWTVSWPELRGFNFAGGSVLSPEYVALLLALTTYTAAFIAEIVRAGILSVSQGQWEASHALGLRRGLALRLVVLPQALRVIIPPMTSQYLNLTKNSSLAVAIGYQDIVSITNTTLNQTGQAIEGIAIIMAVFLVVSLSISFAMNWYNARIALVER
ncbi:MAG: ABC transporter permease subunit [Alphaproteobacteria bacterium]|nr:ABC transporter permease subunit [Alphaproteobacteria bacterium]